MALRIINCTNVVKLTNIIKILAQSDVNGIIKLVMFNGQCHQDPDDGGIFILAVVRTWNHACESPR